MRRYYLRNRETGELIEQHLTDGVFEWNNEHMTWHEFYDRYKGHATMLIDTIGPNNRITRRYLGDLLYQDE